MKTDLEIARECRLKDINDIARDCGIPTEKLECYGRHIAKVPAALVDENRVKQNHLILVTAMSPTKAGIGKTTVSVGLSMALNRLGMKSALALREPSLGPCFGMKGGATGGGYAQVVPMHKINLHFTGDFHAITVAHNMIAALLDNYLYQHHRDGFALKDVVWRRVLDVNDRNLRNIITGLGGKSNGLMRESGFDITPASELMAILCLATDMNDLQRRIENILLGVTLDNKPFCVKDLGVASAIAVLLQDALQPNLVQTLEGTPAFIHGGPFANIAHGCNSIMATKLAMTFSDYAVTEAGFGADLGAEKFLDIKCRKAHIHPQLTVLVATIRGLKEHGGVTIDTPAGEQLACVERGLANLDRHVSNLQHMGQTVVVTLNRFESDTAEELALVAAHCAAQNIGFAVNDGFARGGEGCEELARLVAETIAKQPSSGVKYGYDEADDVQEKVCKIAKIVYGADGVVFTKQALNMAHQIAQWGYDRFPVCVAKTQYSFSDDASRRGVPTDFAITIQDFVINAGAEMIVAIAGNIMRMPGLPLHPQAEAIHFEKGEIVGLS